MKTIRIGFFVAAVVFPLAHAFANSDTIKRGKIVYDLWCVSCHGGGKWHPGTMALEEKYKGSRPGDLSKRTDLNSEMIHSALRKGVSIMPFFRKTEISELEEQELISYLMRHSIQK